jgi:hypothetical protein
MPVLAAPLSARSSRRSFGLLLPLLLAGAILAPAAHANKAISANWSGYVSTFHHEQAFRSVSGMWVVPQVSCTDGQGTAAGVQVGHQETASAVWVGLGGFLETAESLEQVGTQQSCNRSGEPIYEAWYEILPAAPILIRIPVEADDKVSASTIVTGDTVTMRFNNLTTGQHYTKRRHVRVTDVSSAEWIVEAPSECPETGAESECTLVPLAHIEGVTFDRATAEESWGYRRVAGNSYWSSTALTLKQQLGSLPTLFNVERNNGSSGALVTATPSSTGPLGSFSVTVSEEESEAGENTITLPGAGRT